MMTTANNDKFEGEEKEDIQSDEVNVSDEIDIVEGDVTAIDIGSLGDANIEAKISGPPDSSGPKGPVTPKA